MFGAQLSKDKIVKCININSLKYKLNKKHEGISETPRAKLAFLERLDASSAVGEQVFHAVIALAHFERRHLLE